MVTAEFLYRCDITVDLLYHEIRRVGCGMPLDVRKSNLVSWHSFLLKILIYNMKQLCFPQFEIRKKRYGYRITPQLFSLYVRNKPYFSTVSPLAIMYKIMCESLLILRFYLVSLSSRRNRGYGKVKCKNLVNLNTDDLDACDWVKSHYS